MPDHSRLDRRRFIQLAAGIGSGALLNSSCSRWPLSPQPKAPAVAGQAIRFPLRLYANESPYGPFPPALEAIRSAADRAHRYTKDKRVSLKKALADEFGLESSQVLLALIQKNWLLRNQNERYQIHQLQRQYALEKLQENPVDAKTARAEHAAFYSHQLEKINHAMRGSAQAVAFNDIAVEMVNIQIALS